MSLRALIRIVTVATAALPLGLFLWPVAGPWPLLAGPALLALTLVYLALASGSVPASRWQLRYYLPEGTGAEQLATLEGVLRFIADRGGQAAIEAGGDGLVLVAPRALDRYVLAQLERALPEARIAPVEETDVGSNADSADGRLYLCTGPATSEALRWATQAPHRWVALHLHRGPYATLLARTEGERPPGRWCRLPSRLLTDRLGRHLPVWNELSAGTSLAALLPATAPDAAYSSRSRVLNLAPPAGYRPDPGGRSLGQTVDGRPVTFRRGVPLSLVAAPPAYLARLAADDARREATVVVSPQRTILERIARRAEGAAHWIDPHDSLAAAHLAIVAAGEWQAVDAETAATVTRDFLTNLSPDLTLPATARIVDHLARLLATSAQRGKNDFSFLDLYAVSQSVQALRAFLGDLQHLFPEPDGPIGESTAALLQLLQDDAGYVRVVAALSTIRSSLKPLRSGPLHNLSQPPFLDVARALEGGGLLLVPLDNDDFPAYDHLLAAMLDLILARCLAVEHGPRLNLHLHDPQRYHADAGARWRTAAQQSDYLSLVVSYQDPEDYELANTTGAQLFFRCSQALAAELVAGQELPCRPIELADLPDGVALARLPGLVLALDTKGEE